MKIGTCRYQEAEYVFVLKDDAVFLPALDKHTAAEEYQSVLRLVEAGPDAWARLAQAAQNAKPHKLVGDIELLAPIPRPRQNVMCLGWNYSAHVQESADAAVRDAQPPEHPVVFTKSTTSVSGPYSDIPYDASVSSEIDWEVELGVIIGTPMRKISSERSLAHVFGYTVINDVSARDLQFRHQQFFIGKSLTGSCPMGPWITTADEIHDPQNLDLCCRVNGQLKQNSNTRHMIFDVRTIMETLCRGMLLQPGDIIATGTPSGVGFARTPPEFLSPGDVVECEIEAIGSIRNRVTG